jgi:hypothetical protein
MRLITSIQGSVIVRYSPDDAASDVGALTRDVVAFLGRTYNFSVIPEVAPGLIVTPQPFIFQTGKIALDDQEIPINQLTWLVGALVITAKDTETADRVTNEIILAVDRTFGFKISGIEQHRFYQSNIVAEIDPRVETILLLENILNREIPRPEKPFLLKSIMFGSGDPINPFTQLPLDYIQASDFIRERRATEPYERNRYFSSAPIRTRDHGPILEQIERALRAGEAA